MAGLVRPDGPVRIEKTKVLSKDVLVAKLSGSVQGTVAVVRKGEDYYFALPKGLGGVARKVPADSLTDCLHQAVSEMDEKNVKALKKKAKEKSGGCAS